MLKFPCCCLPAQCCVRCRNRKAPADKETVNARKRRLRPITDHLETDRQMKLRQYVENTAEIKKTVSIAKFRTSTDLEERNMDLERRADRLKRIMDDEMFVHTKNLVDEVEQEKDSRIEVMRQRVAELRAKREEEDRRIADEKLEEAFQNSCDPLRTLRVQKMTKDIANDWDEQIKMKKRLECEKEENDRMYEYLWLKDAENKLKRELAYDCVRKGASIKGLEELKQQIEFKKQWEDTKLKIQQKELEVNMKILEEIEEARRKVEEERRSRYFRAKEHVKDMMETKEFYKNRKLKREEIVALEFLKKAIRELYVEQEDRSKAKREMMRAITIYREYLRNRDCFANSRESELQRIIDKVIEEQYQEAYERRRREQAQRQLLFCNVMAGRAKQVEDLKAKREAEEAQYQKEVATLKEEWKKYLQEIEQEKCAKAEIQAKYKQDLDCQVQYNNIRQDRANQEYCRELEVCDMQEEFYKDKVHRTMTEAKGVHRNPFREPLIGKHIKQCLRPV